MKLAHYSDIHVTHFPLRDEFALKRLAAVASYSLIGRGKHFEGSEQRIARLLEDVDAQQVDHALCTGDVTGVATEAELEDCARLFGLRLDQPEKHTVIPGNHDRYTKGAVASGVFERLFGGLCDAATFPLVKQLPGEVTLVCLDSARPTSLIDSSGLVGEAQREKALAVLTDASLKDRFVVVGLHYGLLKRTGQRDARHHGLRDDVEVMALLDRDDVSVDLAVHGHLHTAFTIRTKKRQVFNAGSATDLHTRCGYNVYEIDARAFRVKCSRREWSVERSAYEPAPDSPVNLEIATR